MYSFLSPLDGRYRRRVEVLAPIVSEYGLARYRTLVEVRWLFFLVELGVCPTLTPDTEKALQDLEANFSDQHFAKIKEYESVTNHDVKAVEYLIREYVPESHWAYIHWGCTSEDINNTSYALMLQDARLAVNEKLTEVLSAMTAQAHEWATLPILSRTHGQTATPSTLGKEWAVYVRRLQERQQALMAVPMTAKINGATGTFGAHFSAAPQVDWINASEQFITQKLGLVHQPLTTQIEPHDRAAELLMQLVLASNVLIDAARDIWGYVSLGYFGQKTVAGEVGSSTMPHKVNPIDFENAEGNLKLMRGVSLTLATELPISRWQRDLTDSTLQRNYGLVFGHFQLALASFLKGLGKLEVRPERLNADLEAAPEVLTEAVQTVMRAEGHADAYEQLKAFSRGQALTLPQVHAFIQGANISPEAKQRLLALTPQTYIGLAPELVQRYLA